MIPIIEDWGIQYEKREIDAYNLSKIKRTCLDVLNTYEDEDIYVNITGGTKIMSVGAYEVFQLMGKHIFYVNTAENQIHILTNNRIIPYKNWIDVETYLRAYGQKAKSDQNEFFNKYLPVLQNLFSEMESWEQKFRESTIGILNYYTKLEDNLSYPHRVPLDRKHTQRKDLLELIGLFAKYKLLDFQNEMISIPGEAQHKFINGGWLEALTYFKVSRIPGTDIKTGLEIEYDNGKTSNEYDVVFTYLNRLFLIECKTSNIRHGDMGVNVIYKLNTLKDFAGGLFAKGMLVSFQNLSHHHKNRLAEYKLKYTEELKDLDTRIKNWIK
ncbi:MAG: DUF1887 family protein, partial [Leptospiraceae bacterium]|nr:DUF1887 family protein [Leptospiraceae bacterium]